MLKAILFDLGDTLFDFRPMNTRVVFGLAGRATYEHLRSRGCSLPSFRRYYHLHAWSMCRAYLGSWLTGRDFSSFDILVKICRRMGLDMTDAELRDLSWRWYEPVTDYCTVDPDVIPTLSRLRDRGYKLAIVSNTLIPGFVLDRHLALHNLLEFFPVRIYSSDVGYRKPHPRIFELALQSVAATAAEALFVGDLVKKDILGARSVGMRAILRHPLARSTNHEIADHVIRRISDLHRVIPALHEPPRELAVGDELVCEE